MKKTLISRAAGIARILGTEIPTRSIAHAVAEGRNGRAFALEYYDTSITEAEVDAAVAYEAREKVYVVRNGDRHYLNGGSLELNGSFASRWTHLRRRALTYGARDRHIAFALARIVDGEVVSRRMP